MGEPPNCPYTEVKSISLYTLVSEKTLMLLSPHSVSLLVLYLEVDSILLSVVYSVIVM